MKLAYQAAIIAIAVTLIPQLASGNQANLTPIGAEACASTDGKIPAWAGRAFYPTSLSQLPLKATVTQDQIGADHFTSQPLFIIDSSNYQRYQQHLSAGHQALFKRYPGYTLPIYPSQRPVFFPKDIEVATQQRQQGVDLQDPDGVTNLIVGFPYPLPENGHQLHWNHGLRYRGKRYQALRTDLLLGHSRKRQRQDRREWLLTGTPQQTVEQANQNTTAYQVSQLLVSAGHTDQRFLLLDRVGHPTGIFAWLSNPDCRRCTSRGVWGKTTLDTLWNAQGLMPAHAWDTPEYGRSNGIVKLLEKRQIYVPYNAVKMAQTPAKKLTPPNHIAQQFGRYEMHRT